MSRKKGILYLLALLVLLCGCSSDASNTIEPSPTPPIVSAPVIQAEGVLAASAKKLLSPYEDYLDQVALKCNNNLSYTIPGDMMDKMAQDAQELHISPTDGRYQFTWIQEGQHTYLLMGFEIQEEMAGNATPAPLVIAEDYNPMEDQNTGDYTAAGGGNFKRIYAYDVAEDLSSGFIEITNMLNEEITGHEIFSFYKWNDELLFAYGAMELTVSLDILESNGSYLVTIGKFGKNAVETADYLVFSKNDVPNAVTMDFDQLISSVQPLARISAKGNHITATN